MNAQDIDMRGLHSGPHAALIQELATRCMSDPAIQAVWVGGSLASGKGDEYSDIDFRIAVEPGMVAKWRGPDWPRYVPQEVVGSIFMQFGESALLHHLLVADGTIIDFYVQGTDGQNREPEIAILAHRNNTFYEALRGFRSPAPKLAQKVDPEYVRQFLVDYWIATYKEMKGLARQFDCFQFVGLYTERMMLLRAWHMDVTGTDVSGQVTIHLLSAMHQALDGQVAPGQEAVLGMPCRTPTETAQAIEAIRHEMTVVGRRLADKHGFAYPESLQAVVERTWRRKVESLISR